jgi:hypothetical protein
VYTMTFYLKTALFSLFFGDSGREYRTRKWFKSVFWWFYTKMYLSQGHRHSDSNIDSP